MGKLCAECKAPFDVTEEDLALLEKISPVIDGKTYPLPPPTRCSGCRAQRRFAQRNETKLYRRVCALTGKPMVSLYSEDKPFTVYLESAWSGDGWDALSYGTDFDFSKPFFPQFEALMVRVPRRGMHQDGSSDNCDYTAFGMNNKNSYLAFSCFLCEDVYYSSWTMGKNSMECLVCVGAELLYECVDCQKCYHCFYCHDCADCHDAILLEDCRNCHHCLCCKNLRNKEYHIYNKPVSKEEFEAKRKDLVQNGCIEEKKIFNRWRVTLPTLSARITQSENCSGNYIEQSKNCVNCYDLHLGSQDLRHCQLCGWQAKDMMDCSSAGKNAELLYEMHGAASGTRQSAFVSFTNNCQNMYYCENMKNSSHCFGCIGLANKQFCVFNKQCAEREYYNLVSRIIAHMRETREWGEFFPVSISPFAYNETFAQEHFPLTKEQTLAKGWKWKDVTGEPPQVSKSIPANQLPDSIESVGDDVLEYAIICEGTGKPFRIIKNELDFYRREGLPLPHLHPDERHKRRKNLRTPYRLWSRACNRCNKEIQTSYSPERPEMIVCEECFLKEVY